MFDERDEQAPAWRWLRGFAYFLLLWPLLAIAFALGELDLRDWENVLLALFGPAAIGLALLVVEVTLTRLFGSRAGQGGQPVPSTLRDLSNLGLTMALLLLIDVSLVTVFEDSAFFGAQSAARASAMRSLAIFCAAAAFFRIAARLAHGRARVVDLGEGWDRAPTTIRFLGYTSLVPLLLVCTVMIDYDLRDRPEFGSGAWVALPALLFVGIRSATARAPRWWAKTPWEAWRRRTSLALPWWFLGATLAYGFVALCALAPLGLIDETLSTRGRIASGVVLVPLGAFVLVAVTLLLWRTAPSLLRTWRATLRLDRGTDSVVGARSTRVGGQVQLDLRDFGPVVLEMGHEASALLRWLGGTR